MGTSARAARALLAAAALAGAGLVLLYLAAVRTATGQRFDESGRGGLSAERSPVAYRATGDLLDTISVSSLALLGLAIMAVAAVRGRLPLAAGAGAAILGANVTTQALKRALARPDLAGGGPAGAGSFPSGHVTVAMSLALAVVLVAPPALRWLAALAGAGYAAGIGVAVLAVDWHRPSDVLGAYLVAVAWTGAVGAALAWGEARHLRPSHAPARAVRAAAALAGVLLVAFAATVAVAVARRVDLLRVVDDRTAFVAAAAMSALACAVLCAGVTRLVQRASLAR